MYSQPDLSRLLRKKIISVAIRSVGFLPASRWSSQSARVKTQSLCGFSGTPCEENKEKDREKMSTEHAHILMGNYTDAERRESRNSSDRGEMME